MYREESEGYAKVITALNGHKKTSVTVETVPALVSRQRIPPLASATCSPALLEGLCCLMRFVEA
jgi:hypothetical protein